MFTASQFFLYVLACKVELHRNPTEEFYDEDNPNQIAFLLLLWFLWDLKKADI